MDRNKPMGSSRSSKSKLGLPHHGSELYALGSKSSSSRDEAKSKVMSTKQVPTVSDRKRDAPSSLVSSSSLKKPKLTSTVIGGGSSKSLDRLESSGGGFLEYWEQIAMDSEPVDLINNILSAIDQQDSDTVVALVCGAIKLLISPRGKPESILTLSFLYLAKIRPNLFCNETITSALVSVLRRDLQHAFKGRNNPTAHILAANLLARGHHDKKQWPEIFLKLYVDDAINERVWVDYDECSSFVENICTAFGTKTPPKSMLQPELISINPARDALGMDEESGDSSNAISDAIKSVDLHLEHNVQPRYSHILEKAEKLVLDTIKEQLNRRQPDCSTRNFLKFLANTSGLVEVRAMAVTRLELWIHNGKLNKPAQELLTYICFNVSGQVQRDQEVLSNLVKMRLKTKPLINIYMICLKEMINLQPDILMILLKYVVQNELSNARNPNNMGMLANMFQVKPDESAKYLAEIYQEFLLQREDCLRTLRVFLRELVKMLRYDINLMIFCKSFMNIREDLQPQISKFEFKDRIFTSMVDLICLSMFLSVSPQIREANVSMKNGRDKGSTILYNFYSQMSMIQSDALTWLYQIVPVIFIPNGVDYAQALHKLLLLDAPEQYSKGDQWPPEPERTVLLRLVSEVPLNQDSILSIVLIGITKDIPFSIPDSMEIIEQVVRRASGLKISDYPPLEANKLEMIDFFFSMAEYHHPEEIALPAGYKPPKLAITSLYWKAWNILLMLSAHNPSIFGSYCWGQYPILKNLMEMCITNQFSDVRPQEDELQICSAEKTQILEFETYLAAATSKIVITEQTSLLLSQLMLMDPLGISRRPPNYVLEQLKSLNANHKLGHLLCRCRQPDLLLDIIQRHGTSQSLPWLADLVQNSDGDFNHLPVQCLCEFLLANSMTFSTENDRDTELLRYLQTLLQDEANSHQTSCEVLEYFLRRLSSTSKQSRFLAIKGLRLLLAVFQPTDDEANMEEINDSDWLLRQLPEIPHFIYVKPMIIAQLRAACQVENYPELIMIYIQFIAAQTIHDTISDMLEHVMDMSQLIVERSTVFSYIIPTLQDANENKIQTLNCLFIMFNNFLIKLREQSGNHSWPEYPDLLMVHFPDGTQLPIHLNIIQAFVILLTHSPLIQGAMQIIDYWFPLNYPPLQAVSIETSEAVQILPDWLKIKMIRSPVERLVDIALVDLTPDQIVLFVQNFGTPVTSMSKLLALLDRAVIEQFDSVKSIILNTAYLAQLIEIQQARGAKNGHIAVQALELHGQVIPDPEKKKLIVLETLIIDKIAELPAEKSISKSKEIEEIVEHVLTQPTLNKVNSIKFRRLAQQIIVLNKKMKSKSNPEATIHMHEYISSKVLNYLMKICKSPHSGYFFQNISQKSSVCSLFRCLMTWIPDKSENYKFFVQVMDECIKCLNPNDHNILLQILLNKRKIYIKTPDDVKKNDNNNFIEIFQSTKQFGIEKRGKSLLNDLIKVSNTSYLVESLSSVLKLTEFKDESTSILYNNKNHKGLLVDWLAEIDSELITSNPNIQMDLLFNTSLKEFRFYMLSLLSHQASWATLHNTINKLLENYNPAFDPTSVLDFISALVNNPKLWQGRDKAAPKHELSEYILTSLNEKQIHVLIEYILNESSTIVKDRIALRINLLINSFNFDEIDLKKLVMFVENYKLIKNCDKTKITIFLQNLYSNIPPIKFVCGNLKNIYNADLTKLTGCPADKVLQYIITTIASLNTASQREYQQMETELLIRKLAASHPSLFLRQLSVLSGLLQGRAHMDYHILKNDFHLLLFSQILGLFEVLQPQIFENPYKNGLQSALTCYFDLFRYHDANHMILYHFIEFLLAYIQANSSAALNFIEPYTDLIQDLAMQYRKCDPLKQLVRGISLLKHKTDMNKTTNDPQAKEGQSSEQLINEQHSNISNTDHKGAAAIILAPYAKQFPIHANLEQLFSIVQRYPTVDDLIPTLQEIDKKRPVQLDGIFEKLLELIFSSNSIVRSIAHNLIIKHLKNNPGNTFTNSTVLKTYIQCLTHNDISITTSALDTLTEMVICLQEHAPEILITVFDLGISSKLNTSTQLRHCIAAMKTQHAC